MDYIIIIFDELAATKQNPSIGPHVTKTKDNKGRIIILLSSHRVSNRSVNHFFLCSFEMREIGLIVDDIHKTYIKSEKKDMGSQIIQLQDSTTIDLKFKSTLMTINSEFPTMEEVMSKKYPIYMLHMKYEIQRCI